MNWWGLAAAGFGGFMIGYGSEPGFLMSLITIGGMVLVIIGAASNARR